MNPLLKRLLGEAVEDPVEHHLATVGAGVPPAGRSYPERPAGRAGAAETDMNNPEEKREVQIGRRMKTLAQQASRIMLASRPESRAIAQELQSLADELISMHGQPSA